METYHIHCEPREQLLVKEILRRHHDIIINQVTENYIDITIERDKSDSDAYYNEILESINRELHLTVH